MSSVSALVRECVSKIMLPAWLQFYKGSYLSLLHALDCENSTEISSLVLQALFKFVPHLFSPHSFCCDWSFIYDNVGKLCLILDVNP